VTLLSRHDAERAVAPLVSTILLVAVVVVLATTVAAFTLDLGESTAVAPQAAFEAEQGENLTVQHVSGKVIDGESLEVVGGNATIPETVRAGTELEIDPHDDAERVALRWQNGDSSTLLTTVPVEADSLDDGVAFRIDGSMLTDPVAQDNDEAIDFSGLGEQFTVEVETVGDYDGDLTLDVSVSDCYSTCASPPTDRLAGGHTVTVEDGVGTFTIGESGSGADLELGFLGFVPNTSDIDALELDVQGASVDLQEARIRP